MASKYKGNNSDKILKVPRGWKKTIGATTAPKGYSWYSNGQSRFSGKRRIALIRNKVKK